MTTSYQARVDRVMDHVRGHLDRELPLAELAAVAHFSPYHFHRIFGAVTGETVADFVRRARLERAVHLMQAAPQRTLSSIAAETGFATPSDFSRLFRRQYGCAPSSWDRTSRLDDQPDAATIVRARTGPVDDDAGADADAEQDNRTTAGRPDPTGDVRLVRRPAVRLLYRRVRDPWRGSGLVEGYRELTTRMDELGLDWSGHNLIGLSWESGKATDLERLVYDLGFVIDPGLVIPVDDHEPFGLHTFAETPAVEVSCSSLPETAVAWDRLYDWLPASPYEPNDQPAMKRFRRLPRTLAPGEWHVDCSIGLRRRHP